MKQDEIEIISQGDFDIKQILECGQVFSFIEENGEYIVSSCDKIARIKTDKNKVVIKTSFPEYFENYFDLKTDYEEIKNNLKSLYPPFPTFFEGGDNIRILRQDKFQTIISFIVSANNNIKRIKKILFAMCNKCGKSLSPSSLHAFPTIDELSILSIEDFKALGLGYRAEYLYKTIRKLKQKDFDIDYLSTLKTPDLRQKLLSLDGVGPKVASCILFFGFSRTDVFPVDTWIRKAYSLFCKDKRNDKQIEEYFISLFGIYSGYAQQYVFNYMLLHSK